MLHLLCKRFATHAFLALVRCSSHFQKLMVHRQQLIILGLYWQPVAGCAAPPQKEQIIYNVVPICQIDIVKTVHASKLRTSKFLDPITLLPSLQLVLCLQIHYRIMSH